MRKLLLIAGVAALTIPGLANAQTTCHHEKNQDRVVGTVVGAGLGALLGSAIAGHHDRGTGAVVGAIGGVVVGNAVGGSQVHCDRYDNGYYDRDGYWHTASANGSGYYDRYGRWIATPPPEGGYYDRSGRWVSSAPSRGYYDRYGHWVAGASAAGGYGADVSYRGGNLYARENGLEQRIRSAEYDGRLSRYDADRLFRQLNAIRSRQAQLRDYHGGLTDTDVADLSSRLDYLTDQFRNEVQ